MTMWSQTQVGQAGEGHVVQWLQQNGYRGNWDTRSMGSTDIEARGSKESLLVQVKSAVSPGVPASLTPAEEQNIKSRASKLGVNAYEARVTLDQKLGLVGNVAWRKLT